MTPAHVLLTAAAELSTGEKLSTALSKKSGRKRENPPCTPYKRKARGKENKPGFNSPGLSAGAREGAYAGVCERIRAREALLKRHVEAAVEDALVAFCGTRRNPLFDREPQKDPCDERLWANFVWDLGGERGWRALHELTLQGISEMAQRKHPVPDAEKPRILQNLINKFLDK